MWKHIAVLSNYVIATLCYSHNASKHVPNRLHHSHDRVLVSFPNRVTYVENAFSTAIQPPIFHFPYVE